MRLRRAASGPKSLPFRAVLRKATAWMSSCKIFAKRLKDVFRLKSPRPNRAAPNGCWNCLHEILIRPRLRSYRRASWLDPASRKWQSSYLRQEWKRRAAFNSDPRQQAAEDGPATFGEARGDFRRRFLTPHSIGLNDEALLPSPALAGSGAFSAVNSGPRPNAGAGC